MEPAPLIKYEARHLFIHEASTKSYTDSVEVVNRIVCILRVGKPAGLGRAIVAGDEKTLHIHIPLKAVQTDRL